MSIGPHLQGLGMGPQATEAAFKGLPLSYPKKDEGQLNPDVLKRPGYAGCAEEVPRLGTLSTPGLQGKRTRVRILPEPRMLYPAKNRNGNRTPKYSQRVDELESWVRG